MKKEENKEGFFKRELGHLKQEIRNLNKALRTINLRVDMLQKISKIMGLSLPLDELLEMIMDVILSIIRVDAGSILLIDKETDELVFKVTKGEKAEEVKRFRLRMGEGIAGWVARKKKPLLVPDVTKDKRHKKEIPEAIKYETRNILCVPLLVKREAIGVIEVINKRETPFHKEDQELLLSIASQLSVLIENALLFDELSKETKRLQTLIEVSRMVNQTLNLKELLKIIMGLIEGVMRTEASSLMLIDEETDELTFEVALGEKCEEVKKMRVPMGEGIAGWVAREKKPLNVPDVSKDPRFFKKVDDFSGFKTRNILCVPLSIKDKTIGTMEAINTLDRREFDSDDLSLFEALAQVVAVAIENARLYQDLQELFVSAVKALASAIETKDPYTRGHSEGVAEYSVIIAKELGFSKEKQEVVRLAGLLHDIGKIGIDEKTLLKPTSLTEEEYLKIKGHPGLGVKIIAPIKKLEEVISGVRNHHERFDGCGYPDGLRGKDIDILARIVALADTFDAMTSDRAYRKAYPLDEALKEIESCANTQFDPEVVAAFFRAYKKGLIKKVY